MTFLTFRPAASGLGAARLSATPCTRPAATALSTLVLTLIAAGLAPSALAAPAAPRATKAPTPADLQKQIDAMRQSYDARIQALESQLQSAQRALQAQATSAPAQPPTATDASGITPPAHAANAALPADAPLAATPASANGFNPQVSLNLSGTYASLQRDPTTWQPSGFLPAGGEAPARGFNLGESELTFSAHIDPWFFGALTLAVSPENEIAAEEAFIQTTALPTGLKLKAGRFYAGLGYLNEQHAHTWDFVDAPLAYQAFLGGQYKQEGVQARWLAPTEQFIELSAELGRGAGFPGTERNRNGAGAVVLAARTGGDVGNSHSWRAGLSWLRSQAQDRSWDTTDLAGQSITNAFTGSSQLWVLDGVWKWAPNGNATRTSFKLQGEYFRRKETGDVAYDTADVSGAGSPLSAYRSVQSGWYLQGIYQFMPGWRVGLRHDQLDSGSVNHFAHATYLAHTHASPRRNSLMLDWSLSEFSRWRIQLSDDRSREGITDRQLFLQYQMSLGAHGAHSY